MAYETLPFLVMSVFPTSDTILVFSCARISSHLFLGNLHVFQNSPQKSVEKLGHYNLTIVKA